MNTAFIALGSNLGDRAAYLHSAYSALQDMQQSIFVAASPIYESAAIGPGTQKDYLNAVVELATELAPEELLDALQQIEKDNGRERSLRWGPRTLDLDILLYGNLSIDTPRLRVPHERLFERNFVLQPLADIVPPHWVFPDGSKISDRLAAVSDSALTRVEAGFWQESRGATQA